MGYRLILFELPKNSSFELHDTNNKEWPFVNFRRAKMNVSLSLGTTSAPFWVPGTEGMGIADPMNQTNFLYFGWSLK